MARLTDPKISALKQQGKYADGAVPALYVEVTAAGSKIWRLKFRLAGKENRATLGRWPDVDCAEARRRALEARAEVSAGVVPGKAQKAQESPQEAAQDDMFETVARQWLESRRNNLSERVWEKYGRVMAQWAYPLVGRVSVGDLKLQALLDVVRRVGDRPAMARLVMRLCESVLDHAEEHERIDRNVLAGRKQSKTNALPKPTHKPHAAVTDAAQLGGYLRALDAYKPRGSTAVLDALRLLAMTPARAGELVAMRWEDVDTDAGTWTYHMGKVDRTHTAFLPRQALELLAQVKADQHRRGLVTPWVFPSEVGAGRHVARNALLAGMRRLGFTAEECTAHGWRATWRTLGAEVLGIEDDVLELALGHKLRGDVHRGAYNRVTKMDQRREAAQRWADWLDEIKAQA